jgi:methionyl-tRNA synthetase
MSRYYVTTPIYYVNDVPHLGTSYTTIAADAVRRYRQLRGAQTRMLTGTDEHGLKLEREARDRGVEPAKFVDDMSARFRSAWPLLEIEPDDFIRTTEGRHTSGAAAFWQRIVERNPEDIYLGHYEGWLAARSSRRKRSSSSPATCARFTNGPSSESKSRPISSS